MTIFGYTDNQIFNITNTRYVQTNQLNVKEKFFISVYKKNFGSKMSTELLVLITLLNALLNMKYKSLIDSTICDISKLKNSSMNSTRFYIIHILRSLTFSNKIILVSGIGKENFCYSIEEVFNGANWSEREMFDMFGISFIGNTNMKRILTDYGFVGLPPRKDFPITGSLELNHNSEFETIIYEPVTLMQEERIFESYNSRSERVSKISFGFDLDRILNHNYILIRPHSGRKRTLRRRK
jgi:NADH:ubiquinone oxidoreductase subunit C